MDAARGDSREKERPKVFDVLRHDPATGLGGVPEDLGVARPTKFAVGDHCNDVVAKVAQSEGDLFGIVLVEKQAGGHARSRC